MEEFEVSKELKLYSSFDEEKKDVKTPSRNELAHYSSQMKTDIRESADEINMSVNHPTNENLDTSMDAMHGFGDFGETTKAVDDLTISVVELEISGKTIQVFLEFFRIANGERSKFSGVNI